MKTRMVGLAVLFAVTVAGSALAGPIGTTLDASPGLVVMPDRPILISLHDTMRQQWADHTVWSRMVVMGVLAPMEGCEFYEDRLARNDKDLEALFAQFYGNAAEKFGLLIQTHNKIESELLYAMKSDDQKFRSILTDWYKNADEIAVLLSQLNPKYWPREEMSQIWRMHLDTSLDQAFAFNKGDWQYDVMSFDSLQQQSTKMADFLSDGILKQFSK